MRIALMQAEAAVLDVEANLASIGRSARRAREAGAELLLTPELFPVGYAPRRLRAELDPARIPVIADALTEIARTEGIALVYSLPEVRDARWHITAAFVAADGMRLAQYTKVHLFGAEEKEAFAPGSESAVVVDYGGLRWGIVICYDVEFPESVRAAALRGAQALLVPTALGTGYSKVTQRLIPTRALESQLYIAYANHAGVEEGFELSGGSVVADPYGEIEASAGPEGELLFADVVAEHVEAARRDVPYLRDRRGDLYREWERR